VLIAVLALAMIFGGIAATAALGVGWSLLAALAVYSGCGLLSVLAITLSGTATSTPQNRKADRPQTDISI
jgi:hypothetical protein